MYVTIKRKREGTRFLRVIFRTFYIDPRFPAWVKFQLTLIKLITTPPFYEGLKYDHAEIFWDDSRISIRAGKDGVYNIKLDDGLQIGAVSKKEEEEEEEEDYNPIIYQSDSDNSMLTNITSNDSIVSDYNVSCVNLKNMSFMEELGSTVKDMRYKLVFCFEISDEQENKLNDFLGKHTSEPYSLNALYWNVLVNKTLCCLPYSVKKKLMVDDWNNSKREVKRWDCITLILRILCELEILPEKDDEGKDIPMLGLSAFDAAHMLLDLHLKGTIKCYHVISRELAKSKKELEEWEEALSTFYHVISKKARNY